MKVQTNKLSVIFISSLLLFLLLFSVTSCKESEECFSCDPEIDSWVKENKTEIVNFERVEIATYSHSYQKAILAVLSPERKKVLWQEKVNHILILDIPKEEIEYLKWYAKAFKSFNYLEPIPKDLEEEMYERTIEGMEKFGWSRAFVYQTFFILGDVDLNIKTLPQGRVQQSPEVDCACFYDIGCGIVGGDCDLDYGEECGVSNTDCGIFGGTECTGECK